MLFLIFGLFQTVTATPNYWVYGCAPGNVSADFAFCDHTLPVDQRVEDLLSRLTLEEKLNIIGADDQSGCNVCNMMDHGVEKLGIPAYMNLVETNSAVAASCVSENVCATNFPSPSTMAASFNRALWYKKGEILSDEMRAFNNYNWHRGTGDIDYIGLTGFGPNINLVRDPRWGRNSEVPSEDPILSGEYASNMVRGMQEGSDPKYIKMLAGLKHYIAYSVEDQRDSFIPNITDFDLWDTYLVQYQIGFAKGDVRGGIQGGNAYAVMSSYSGLNGVPAVDNKFIVQDVLRGAWERDEVIVATDCGSISNGLNAGYTSSNEDAAAKALNAGTDLDLGDTFYSNGALEKAIDQELTNEEQVNAAIRRVFTARIRAGMFDPLELQMYTDIPIDVVNSTEHHDFILEAAEQGIVLLKNDNDILPMTEGKKLAVIGPHATSTRDLFESYLGDELCIEGGYDCVQTIGTIFSRMNNESGGETSVEAALDIFGEPLTADSYAAAVDAASNADQIILAFGIGNEIEYETHDRTEISLPGLQQDLILEILALDKPCVILLVNGGALAVENIVPNADAMIEAFYPGRRGGEALYNAVFGRTNKFGRLPMTIYKSTFIEEQAMTSFDMTTSPGRTYRYYVNPVSFNFGFGLSYTEFTLMCKQETEGSDADMNIIFTCRVENIGDREGDEVLMVYHLASDELRNSLTHPAPIKTLVDYTRLTDLKPSGRRIVTFTIPVQRLVLTNNDGDKVLYEGVHYLKVTNGNVCTYTTSVDITSTIVYPSL